MLVACRNRFHMSDQHIGHQPICRYLISSKKDEGRFGFSLFYMPNCRNVGCAKRCRDRIIKASPSTSELDSVNKSSGVVCKDLRGYGHDSKLLAWDDGDISLKERASSSSAAAVEDRNMEARTEAAITQTLQKLGKFTKLHTSNLLGFLLAAVEFLNASYAFGVDVKAEDCNSIARQDNTTLIVVTCIVEAIALTGAAVGGTLARQRKLELERINAQLRQIFAKMRRQYEVESYAPSLTYAPAGIASRLPDSLTLPESRRVELMNHLKAGKKFLREQNPERAFEEFKKALPIAKELKDVVEEKKAARGLGASCQRQGKFRDAIKYHSMVLTLSHLTGERSGDTEALGAIADCYTELGDLETAGRYYDQYIARMDAE